MINQPSFNDSLEGSGTYSHITSMETGCSAGPCWSVSQC